MPFSNRFARLTKWLPMLCTVGCQHVNEKLPSDAPVLFEVPLLTQFRPSAQEAPPYPSLDTIPKVWPSVIGRYAFARRITLEKHGNLLPERDLFQGNSIYRLESSDSLATDGLEVVANYPCTVTATESSDSVAHQAYPVYVANSTSHSKYLYGSVGVYAIQEAKGQDGRWHPIERIGSAWCGNSSWIMSLPSRHFMVFLARKYEGDFSTLLRIRLRNGPSHYVSAPYPGRINKKQFTVSRKEYHALEMNQLVANDLYIGARPVAIDSINERQWQKYKKEQGLELPY